MAALVVVMGASPRNIKEHLFRTRKGKIVGQPRQISFNHPEATSFAQAYMAIFFLRISQSNNFLYEPLFNLKCSKQ